MHLVTFLAEIRKLIAFAKFKVATNTKQDIPWEAHGHLGHISCPTAPSWAETYGSQLPGAPLHDYGLKWQHFPKGPELTRSWKCDLSWQGSEADL